MAELLLELLSEEIPAKMQLPMAANFKKSVEERLKKENLYFKNVETYITPRRLTLVVDGLSLTQENSVIERKGPRIDAPQQAIEGFLRSTGLRLEQLTRKRTNKGEFLFAIFEQKALPTKEILKTALEDIISAFTWPKSMCWGDNEIRWVRPLKNIAAVFGGEVLNIKFGHIESNNKTVGHRFLSGEEFSIDNFEKYKAELKENFVILDSEDRKCSIAEQSVLLAKSKNLDIVGDDALLDEVTGLVEYPEVLLGAIDAQFMDVPEEVLISSIRTHQKYFCLRCEDKKLAPYFLVTSNMKTDDGGAAIRAGNEKVLRARLSDAKFFWDQDRKIALEDRAVNLEKVIFHRKLGSVADKTKRIRAVAKFLSVWIPHADLKKVERAAELCKSDLVTEMVGEFPDLQGIMGCYYASNDNEELDVAKAIEEHYSPVGREDKCPTNPVSVAVAIADKMDSLAGLFAIGEKPTGSKDPFALRRAALGVIRIILENRLSIPLRILCENSLKHYHPSVFERIDEGNKKSKLSRKIKKGKTSSKEVVEELLAFFEERLKYLIKGEEVRHDYITAIFSGVREDDLLRVVKRVAALDKFLKTEDGANLLAAYKRAVNILRIEEKKDDIIYKSSISKGLLEQDEEKSVCGIIQDIRPDIKEALKESRFEDAMGLLSDLRDPVDDFFDKVKVNAAQADVRKNRLGILSSMRELFEEVADFSVIEG